MMQSGDPLEGEISLAFIGHIRLLLASLRSLSTICFFKTEFPPSAHQVSGSEIGSAWTAADQENAWWSGREGAGLLSIDSWCPYPIVSATSSPCRESKWMMCSTDLWESAQEVYPPPIWITTKVINQGNQCCPRPEFLNQLRWQYLNLGPQFPISWLVKKLVLIVIITDTFRDVWGKQDLINDEFPYSWQLLDLYCSQQLFLQDLLPFWVVWE